MRRRLAVDALLPVSEGASTSLCSCKDSLGPQPKAGSSREPPALAGAARAAATRALAEEELSVKGAAEEVVGIELGGLKPVPAPAIAALEGGGLADVDSPGYPP